MKSFEALTEIGKARRLRTLAWHALAQYPIEVRRLSYMTTATNVLFRVDTVDRQKFALRVCEPGEHTIEEAELEAAWLAHLSRASVLRVPQIVLTNDGDFWTEAAADGVPEARRCQLFSWIPGKPIEESLTVETYRKLGVLAARMHALAETFTVPSHLKPPRWDTTFYWVGDESIVEDAEYDDLFSAENRQLLNAIIAKLEPYLSNLFTQPKPIILHGDLHVWNVHIHRNKLYALDFEDLMMGFPIQDIAITFYYTRTEPNSEALHAAYQAGYETVRAWPVKIDGELELLMAGRMIMFCNYVAKVMSRKDASEYLDGWMKALAGFEASGYKTWKEASSD